MHSRLKTIWYIASMLMLVLVAGCGSGEDGSGDEAAAAPVSVEDLKYNLLPGGSHVLTGKLRNAGGAHIRIAQVMVSLYDVHNQRVSTMRIDVRDIAPGADRAFRQTVDSDQDVRSAKVRSVLLL